MSARMSLKNRTLAALAAILGVVVAFYAAPRWWQTRPRFYPKAYEAAVTAAKEAFGSAAVKGGIVTVPRLKVSVPYEGQAVITDALARVRIYAILSPAESHILVLSDCGDRPDERAAQVPVELMREKWAMFQYIEGITHPHGASTSCRIKTSSFDEPSRFNYRTWPSWRGEYRAQRNAAARQSVLAEVLARDLAKSHAIQAFICDPDVALSGGKDDVASATEAILPAFLPPREEYETLAIRDLAGGYADAAGKRALPFLKEIDSMYQELFRGSPRIHYILEDVPVAGGIFRWLFRRDWPRGDFLRLARDVTWQIWAQEALDGKTDSECLAVLSQASLGANPDVKARAMKLLAKRWPEEWKELVLAKFDTLNEHVPAYWCVDTMRADARVARLVTTRRDWRKDVTICAAAYESTKDVAFLDALKKAAMAQMNTDLDKSRFAVTSLFRHYRNGEPVGDVPTFTRALLGKISREDGPGSGLAWTVIRELGHVCDDASAAVLRDIVLRPETVFKVDYARTDACLRTRQEAARALGRTGRTDALEALTQYLGSDHPDGDAPLVHSVVDALGDMGRSEALAALREIEAREAGHARVVELPEPRGEAMPIGSHVRRAIVTIRLKTATDRVVYFLSLSPDDMYLISAANLSKVFSLPELRGILADERANGSRGSILKAIFVKERGLLERSFIEEQGYFVIDETGMAEE